MNRVDGFTWLRQTINTSLNLSLRRRHSGKPALRRIVIDAGHGGNDSGAKNDAYRLHEKNLTLDVSQRLKSMLERRGYEVIMTRERDVFIPLERRPQIANRAKGDLFISIHFNSAARTTAEGYETFALTPQYQASSKYSEPGRGDNRRYDGNNQDPWNTLLGYHAQRSLVETMGGTDRGLKRARFLVLKHLNCPGVLLELGFVSILRQHKRCVPLPFDNRLPKASTTALSNIINAYNGSRSVCSILIEIS